MNAIGWAAALAGGFLLGSIPSGLWWGRLASGVDVREHGSKNLGATNVFRVLGPAHGATVLILDIAKGAAAVLAGRLLASSGGAGLAAGIAAILGHIFSPWAGFRGGKGVATGLGLWIVSAPIPTSCALGVWGLVLLATRRVSAGSLAASALLPICVWFGSGLEGRALLEALAVLTATLVWIRHAKNISRLVRGEEPPLWGRSK